MVTGEKGESRGSEEEKRHSWIKDLCNCWITASQAGEGAGTSTEYKLDRSHVLLSCLAFDFYHM